jgi:hypothetical protein
MNLRSRLEGAAFALLAQLVGEDHCEQVACGTAASNAFEVSITVIRRSAVAALEGTTRSEPDRPTHGPDLSDAHWLVFSVIGDKPVADREVSTLSGYKLGKYLERLLRDLRQHDLIVRRHLGWVRVKQDEGQ